MFQRLRLLQLGNHRKVAAAANYDLLRHADITRRADKRERNHIYAVLKPKLQVFAIFLSERGYRQRDARQIDSLMLGQDSAVNHLALHVVTANARDTQLDQSVGYKNPRPGSHLACQTLESSRDQG